MHWEQSIRRHHVSSRCSKDLDGTEAVDDGLGRRVDDFLHKLVDWLSAVPHFRGEDVVPPLSQVAMHESPEHPTMTEYEGHPARPHACGTPNDPSDVVLDLAHPVEERHDLGALGEPICVLGRVLRADGDINDVGSLAIVG